MKRRRAFNTLCYVRLTITVALILISTVFAQQSHPNDITVKAVCSSEALRAIVTIDTNVKPKPYSPMIFGGFLEHFNRQIYGGIFDPGSPLSDKNGYRKDVVEALKELKVPVLRWPGGCFASGYHWKDGVGKNRKPTDDMAWGVKESNAFGTDEFVEFCRFFDCQPFICTNAGNGTVEEMVEWVEYCNQDKGKSAQMRKDNGHVDPLNVKIWSIGNENYSPFEIGGEKSIEQWGPFVLDTAKKIKAVDPDIKLAVPAIAGQVLRIPDKRQWVENLLETAGDYIDYISVHGYWFHLNEENKMPDYLSCIMKSDSPEARIIDAIKFLDKAGYRGRIKITYDEWNLRGWHHPGFPRTEVSDYDDPEIIELVKARDKNLIAKQYTMADALFSASFFNACLRHADDVGMANIAPLANTRGPLYIHPEGVVRRTTFHTMAMYANLLGSRVGKTIVEAEQLANGDESVSVVDAIATVDDAGKMWSVALVNRHPSEEIDCTVELKGAVLSGQLDATVLAGDSPDAYNDIKHPNRAVPESKRLAIHNGVIRLAPHSLTIVKMPIK